MHHLFIEPNAFRSILILIASLIIAYWLSRFLAKGIIYIAQKVGRRSDNESDDARVMRLRQTETYLSITVAIVRALVVAVVGFVAWRALSPFSSNSAAANSVAAIGASAFFIVIAGQTIGIILRDLTAGSTMITEGWYKIGDFIKIEVVHNAIDLASLGNYEYDKRTYKYLESLREEGYTVVSTVTRFTAQKGLVQLMRGMAKACSKHDKLVMLLAGDGEQRNELISLAADLGISDKVFFTGFVRGKQWRDAYSVADIFVMSSVSEPFGLTALEAAHHGTALIISKQSGVGEVLNSIFRYDFWDVDRLADQLVGIAKSPALCAQLKQDVKREYARLSWHDVARTCLHLYKRMKIGATA